MKQTKKVLGILLALLMCFSAMSVGFTVSAEENLIGDYPCIALELKIAWMLDTDPLSEMYYPFCGRNGYANKNAYEEEWNNETVQTLVSAFVNKEIANVESKDTLYVLVGSYTKNESTSPLVYTFNNGTMDSDGITIVDSTALLDVDFYALKVTCYDAHSVGIHEGYAGTCTENGYNDCYCCENCQKYFEDETCETEITDYENWKLNDGKIVNSHDWEVHEANEPTCQKFGNEWYRVCKNCNRCEKANEEKVELLPYLGKVDHKDDDKDGKCDWCGLELSTPTPDPTPTPATTSDYECPLCGVASEKTFVNTFLITIHSFVHIIWGIFDSFGLVK